MYVYSIFSEQGKFYQNRHRTLVRCFLVRPSLNIIVSWFHPVNPSVKAQTFNLSLPLPCARYKYLGVCSSRSMYIRYIYMYTVARFDQSSLGEISGSLRIYIIRIKQIECKFTTHYTRSSFTGRIERGNEKEGEVERQRDCDASYYPPSLCR